MLQYAILALIILGILLASKPGRDFLESMVILITTGGLLFLMIWTVGGSAFFESNNGKFLTAVALVLAGIITVIAVLNYVTEILAIVLTSKKKKAETINLETSEPRPEPKFTRHGNEKNEFSGPDKNTESFNGRIVRTISSLVKPRPQTEIKLPTKGKIENTPVKAPNLDKPPDQQIIKIETKAAALEQIAPYAQIKLPAKEEVNNKETKIPRLDDITKSPDEPAAIISLTPQETETNLEAIIPGHNSEVVSPEKNTANPEIELQKEKTTEPEFPKYPGSGRITDYSTLKLWEPEPPEKEDRIDWEKIAKYLKKKKDTYIVYDFYVVLAFVALFIIWILVMFVKIVLLSTG